MSWPDTNPYLFFFALATIAENFKIVEDRDAVIKDIRDIPRPYPLRLPGKHTMTAILKTPGRLLCDDFEALNDTRQHSPGLPGGALF